MSLADFTASLDSVYGRSFAAYDPAEMERFIEPLQERFDANQLDPAAAFAGKRVLDAGCGNGRGMVFMARYGAREIQGIDLSPLNIASSRHNAERLGITAEFREGDLSALPFPDAHFDVVWCNGVVMHSHDPDKTLAELARVLKPGGLMWIYVYGAGGLYWRLIRAIRASLKDIDSDSCLDILALTGQSVRYAAQFIDDWKTPFIRSWLAKDFTAALNAHGFDCKAPLARGASYDFSEKLFRHPEQRDWLGEGDLRYLAVKSAAPGAMVRLPGGEYGTIPPLDGDLETRFGARFDRLLAQGSVELRLLTAARINRLLHDELTADDQPQLDRFDKALRDVEKLLARILAGQK